MPAPKLTLSQQIDLDAVTEAHTEVVTQRRLLKIRLQEEFNRQFSDLLKKRSRAANRALAHGVSKSKVGRALGTTNWNQINDVLALTQDELIEERARVEDNKPWTWNPDTGTLVLREWLDRSNLVRPVKRTDVITLQLHREEDYGWNYTPEDMALVNWDTLGPIRDEIRGAEQPIEPELEPAQTDPYANAAQWATNRDWEEED